MLSVETLEKELKINEERLMLVQNDLQRLELLIQRGNLKDMLIEALKQLNNRKAA